MSNKKLYTVTYGPTLWECTIEIDHDFIIANVRPGEDWTMEQAMREMISFWMGGEDRIAMNDGNVTETFIQQIAREINYIQAGRNLNITGVKSFFKNREGWWSMDGTYGIDIKEIDEFEFDHYDYKVAEVPANEHV